MNQSAHGLPILPRPASETLLREALEKLLVEPEVLLRAATILDRCFEPNLKQFAIALAQLAFQTYAHREWTPRPPEKGNLGRPRDPVGLERLKKKRGEFDRAAVTAFRLAIRGGPMPPAWILAGYRGEELDPLAAEEAIAWALEGWEDEKSTRLVSGKKASPPKVWAARAYLRAKGQPHDSESGRALAKRVENASDILERLVENPEGSPPIRPT